MSIKIIVISTININLKNITIIAYILDIMGDGCSFPFVDIDPSAMNTALWTLPTIIIIINIIVVTNTINIITQNLFLSFFLDIMGDGCSFPLVDIDPSAMNTAVVAAPAPGGMGGNYFLSSFIFLFYFLNFLLYMMKICIFRKENN